MNGRNAGVGLGIAVSISGCGPLASSDAISASTCNAGDLDAQRAVDPWKELLITDKRVMRSVASNNRMRGALSFARTAEVIGWTGEEVQTWLSTWAPPKASCAWLRARATNACNADCSACSGNESHLDDVPLRLVAVVNRVDMAEEQGEGAEGRLVYAVTDGPGDSASARTLPATVIMEFSLRGAPLAWAKSWHALGAHADIDASYTQSLGSLAGAFITRGSLAQVRTHNGAPFDAPSMQVFVLANRNQTPDFAMTADRRPATCSGCHESSADGPALAFQLRPTPSGELAISRFLLDPDNRERDEITRRTQQMQNRLCAQ